jgi:5-methylcytosine-specific restriction endonuclease McrA
MPIRAENRSRYPKDWHQIAARIRERAGDRCEQCGVQNGAMILRGTHKGRHVWQHVGCVFNDVFDAVTGDRLPGQNFDTCHFPKPPIRVVLTVAHLDHNPENCADDNLAALCQRCHNAYDAPHRAATRADRRNRTS